ncbi:MAG: phosphonoacetate hydrolase [SAR202 cluster bacterium]|nr:phosphonoacetate hydrolase [SAR202 cluster bacterium]
MAKSAVELNGVTYRMPTRPVMVVCIDGGDPSYIQHGLKRGFLPNIAAFAAKGFSVVAEGAMPSLTNPNNMSIVTGRPPSVHGISGNYFLDPATGAEVMMNDPSFLRAETILSRFSQSGAKVVSITAKDKLRQMLGKGLDFGNGCINFSAEKADRATKAENGIDDVLRFVGLPLADVYSADLSHFVLEAGVKILEKHRPEIMYLSLTDYIQHKYAPGTPEADDFFAKLDHAFGRLAGLGAVVAITADHGMSDKSKPEGSPNVLYLQDALDAEFGPGRTRVILPITDPYVVHHGALGGFSRVYCGVGVRPRDVQAFARSLPGVEAVYDKKTACRTFEQPADREGDVVVISNANAAIGSSQAKHDLSGLKGHRLRSHGGLAERRVPVILSSPLSAAYRQRAAAGVRSYEIFDYAINGT